jgi:exopolysaccharide biosynthesis polyprenyl glycosylphosphotransferase
MKRSEILFTALRVPLDTSALFAAFITAYYIRDQFVLVSRESFGSLAARIQYIPGGPVLPLEQYIRYISMIIPVMLVLFAVSGLYTIRLSTPWFKQLLQIIVGVSVGEFAILLLFLLKGAFFLPRLTVLYSWILAILLVFLGRYFLHLLQSLLFRRRWGEIRVGLIGNDRIAAAVSTQLKRRPYAGYRLAFQQATPAVEEVAKKIAFHHLDELLVVSETVSNNELIALRNLCLEKHVGFGFIPSLFTELPCTYEVEMLGNLPRVEVRPTPLEGWGRVMKRTFDILVSFLLLLLFSPLFILLAAWIKISSPGPLIFRHRRIGYQRQPITVWKFRTMHYQYCTGEGYQGNNYFQKLLDSRPDLKEEWEATHKLKNDPRVSLPGKFLRKTSLDELPQFFNVLHGTLSLVGPRPIVEDEVQKYGESARILFTVKPGLTGLWQVSGRNDVSYEERTRLDAEYIERWNIWRDIVILSKTAWMMLRKSSNSGAY